MLLDIHENKLIHKHDFLKRFREYKIEVHEDWKNESETHFKF